MSDCTAGVPALSLALPLLALCVALEAESMLAALMLPSAVAALASRCEGSEAVAVPPNTG